MSRFAIALGSLHLLPDTAAMPSLSHDHECMIDVTNKFSAYSAATHPRTRMGASAHTTSTICFEI